MKISKKLKLLALSIILSSSTAFPSSFHTPVKNNKTTRNEFPYLTETAQVVTAPIESPNNINFFAVQDTTQAIEDDENENAPEFNPFLSGFNFSDDEEERTYSPEQEVRFRRRIENREEEIAQEAEARKIEAQKEIQENILRSKVVLTSIVSQIEINNMIEEKSKNLSEEELKFLSIMNNVSKTTLNPNLVNMQNIAQIESFRAITDNFTDASALQKTPYAIIYLNSCAQLYPIAQELNELARSKQLCVKTSETNCVPITSFDFFHVLIGEMKNISDLSETSSHYGTMLKGGHLYLPALTPKIRLFESYDLNKESGCFNLIIKTLTTKGRGIKTYYPYGQTPYEIFDILLSAIDYHNISYSPQQADNITIYTEDDPMTSVKLIGKDVDTILNIMPSGQATFFPSFKNS